MNKTIKALSLVASLVLMGFAPVMADTAPAAPTVTVDGMVDAYYTYNFTNSANRLGGLGNVGQYWNSTDNSYSLGLAETKITAKQGNATAVVELAYQDASNLGFPSEISSNTPVLTTPNLSILQAYASYTSGAFTFTGGRFATWMGNEVIESTSNMNYSHSLLFWYTIPLWNQGLSVSLAVDPTLSITGYATNGWNNNVNIANVSAETFGLNATWAPNSTWKFVANVIDGPGTTAAQPLVLGGDPQDRWVGELIVDYMPSSDWTFALDATYAGQDLGTTINGFPIDGGASTADVNSFDIWGAALYAKYQIASDWSAALRVEELKDVEGAYNLYNLQSNGIDGIPDSNEAREVTLTLTHAFTPAFTTTLEGRYDYALSNGTVFTANNGPFANGSADQLTATLSTAFVF